MNSRRVAALAATIALVALTGCIGPFASGGISDDTLDAEADYHWEAEADAAIEVEVGEYRAVYDLDGETTISLTQRSYYQDRALDVEAVRFRYPNGTELTGSELDVSQSRSTTTIEVPDGNGTLAFTAPSGSKHVVVPAIVEGSYEVALPPGHRVGNFFLSNVGPSDDDRAVVDDRHVLTWEENDSDIQIRFYLARDHYLFWGIIFGGLGIAIGGSLYYRRQIRRLAERRRELAEAYDT